MGPVADCGFITHVTGGLLLLLLLLFLSFFFAFIWFQLAPGFRVWPKIKEGVWPLLGYD
jgi:hypothetical protein